MRVLVTGATGRIGSLVANKLSSNFQLRPRLLVRDVARVSDPLRGAADLVTGDLNDPASLENACRDISAALIVSPVAPNQHDLQCNLVRALINGASGDREPLVVKISGLGTALDSPVDSGRWHAQTEAFISDSGLPFTFLRPLFFMQNLGFQLPAIRKSGVLTGAVGDAAIAMVDVEDIAAVAASLLAGASSKPNQALTLTGPAAYSYSDIAKILSELLQQPVVYQQQSLASLKQALLQRGEPEWHANLVTQFSEAFAAGWANRTTNAVADILQRPARDLPAYLAQALAAPAAPPTNNPFPS